MRLRAIPARVPALAAAVLAAAVLFAGAAAAAGDAEHGGVVAGRWCAACHVVTKNQKSANADAPSFFDVAQRLDNKHIANFLVAPHPPMPNMSLTRKEIDDIVAYIRSLDPRPQPKDELEKDSELPKKG